ncbi:dehydrogenase [Thioclava sp. SK-1]|uniref:gluconate 2-dehydrogenase subunit 3 family protein n=1 Tax=Thioclava sp. SK-1 TaxID=1889770 RepID=UPI0008250B39|nr:gluconate 2-dehydrogenase subunit 3 family protein [Thioclava sp. SK-1]OCX65645.1 dehydrogenase [Thioclava sp. SK-1]
MNRREALFSLGAMVASTGVAASAKEMKGYPTHTALSADHLPKPRMGGALRVFTDETDRKTLHAVIDRLIPADAYGPSASEAGCLEFIDDQLAGDYGAGTALYLQKPLHPENEEAIMGAPQFLSTPRERYDSGLKALEAYAQATWGGAFHALSPDQIDEILTGLEAGTIDLGAGVNGQAFFELMLQNTREGYLADPIYGGNRDMAGWKMIGFPGARYDYRPYVERRGEALNLSPVSLIPND